MYLDKTFKNAIVPPSFRATIGGMNHLLEKVQRWCQDFPAFPNKCIDLLLFIGITHLSLYKIF